MSRKIKISGYTKKINYLGDISYRPFNKINDGIREDTIFTNGNFSVVSNTDILKFNKNKLKNFSRYYSLMDIGLSENEVKKLLINDNTKLRLDPTDLKSYAYFGSIKEVLKITLEKIILNFPAAILIKPYDNNGEISTSINGNKVLFSHFENPFDIKYQNTEIPTTNPLRNLLNNITSYIITDGEKVINLNNIVVNNDSLLLFSDDNISELNANKTLYLRPNDKEVEKFFIGLNDLGKHLLNRDIEPKFSYVFKKKEFIESLGYYGETLVNDYWPTSDGYNLDIDNALYDNYVEKLINLFDEYDSEYSNIIIRQLVTPSILEFDTLPSTDIDNNFEDDQKIKTLLGLYGKSFDQQKKYIDNLKFSTTFTYDNINNGPDKIIPSLANSFGWGILDVVNTFGDISSNFKKDKTEINDIGYTMTNDEIKTEIFKRLIINSPFLYKIKGTRKGINFFNTFFNIPEGLITFNEYIYKTKNKISFYELNELNNELSEFKLEEYPEYYNISEDGYPYIKPNNDSIYFEKGDGGFLEQFKNLIPNFEGGNIIKRSMIVTPTTLFNETFERYSLEEDVTSSLLNITQQTKYDVNAKITQTTPFKSEINDCGCQVSSTTRVLEITSNTFETQFNCDYDIVNLNNRNMFIFYKNGKQTEPTTECCESIGGQLTYSYTDKKQVCVNSEFYDCGRYTFKSVNSSKLEVFRDLATNSDVTLVPSAECCTNDGIPVKSGNGYNCSRLETIGNKCVYIKSITTDKYVKNASITYTNAITERYVDYNLGELNLSKTLNLSVSNSSLTTIYIDGVGVSFTRDQIIEAVGEMVSDLNNVEYFINVNGILINLTLKFIACPTPAYDLICGKLVNLRVNDSTNFLTTTTNLSISYYDYSNNLLNISHVFSGDEYLIEGDFTLFTKFNKNITITINNGVESITKTFNLNEYINYSTANLGNIRIISIPLKDGINILLRVLLTNCVKCPDLDPVSEYLIDNKYYVEFNSGGSLVRNVPFLECCPTNSTPVTNGDGYLCYLREKVNEICETKTTKQTSGVIYNIDGSTSANPGIYSIYAEINGIENETNATITIIDKNTLKVTKTGKYKFEIGGFARHRVVDTIENVKEVLDLSVQSNLVINGKYTIHNATYNYYSDTAATPSTNEIIVNLNENDTIKLFSEIEIYQKAGYYGTDIRNGFIRVYRIDENCGTEVKLKQSITFISTNSNYNASREKFDNSKIIITTQDNKNFEYEFNINANKQLTEIGKLNLSNDSIIQITNADRLAELVTGIESPVDNVLKTTWGVVKNMIQEFISVLHHTSNGIYIVRYYFEPTNGSLRPYTIAKDLNTYVYYQTKVVTTQTGLIIKVNDKDIDLRMSIGTGGTTDNSGLDYTLKWDGGNLIETDSSYTSGSSISSGINTKIETSRCGSNVISSLLKYYKWELSQGIFKFESDFKTSYGYCDRIAGWVNWNNCGVKSKVIKNTGIINQQESFLPEDDMEYDYSYPPNFYGYANVYIYENKDNTNILVYRDESATSFECN